MKILVAFVGACSLFGQAAGPSPSVDQGKVLRQLLKNKQLAGPVTITLSRDGRVLAVVEEERCAIPLVEMQKKADPAPMPKLQARDASRMPLVKVPAPSCKQMAKAAPGLVKTGPNAYEAAP